MAGFEHYCARSDDAEAALRNLCLFGHLSGENRARMGWPVAVRIRALRLSGCHLHADLIAIDEAKHASHRAQTITIPAQRKPHPLEVLKTKRAGRNEIPYSGT